MRGPAPLRIELRRSWLAAACVVIGFGSSAILLALLPFEAPYRASAVLALGAHSIWTVRAWALRTARAAIVGVELSADGRVALIERSGARRQGCVRPASYVGTSLVTLVVRLDGTRRSRAIAILPDMLSAEELRRLRVVIRVVGAIRTDVPS